MTPREAVVAEALSWLGTPYHSHACVKGQGVDCVQLLVAAYGVVGIAHPLGSPRDYANDWHLHKSEERYLIGIRDAGGIEVVEPQAGDLMMIRYGHTYSHAGIVVEPGLLVHAYLRRGVILTRFGEDPLLKRDKPRPHLFFTLQGLQP
jgi:cell wall-associated NlpC family hydrolase